MLKQKTKFPQRKDDTTMTNSEKTLELAVAAHQRYLLKATNEDLTTAINCYIETIKENPEQTSAYYRLATLLHKNGQIGVQSAIEQCSKAVKINPDDANAHMYLGYFLSLNSISLPALFLLARNLISSNSTLFSCKISKMCLPTTPVAPSTPITGFLINSTSLCTIKFSSISNYNTRKIHLLKHIIKFINKIIRKILYKLLIFH